MTGSGRLTDTTDPRLAATLNSLLAEDTFPDYLYTPDDATPEQRSGVHAHNLACVARALAAADAVDPLRQQLAEIAALGHETGGFVPAALLTELLASKGASL